MERKKCVMVIMGCLCLVLLVVIGVRKQERKKEQEAENVRVIRQSKTDDQSEESVSERKQTAYENTDGLYFLDGKSLETFKEELETWLKEQGVQPERIKVSGEISEDANTMTFTAYLVVRSEETVNYVRAVCKDDEFQFSFVPELPEQEERSQGTDGQEDVTEKERRTEETDGVTDQEALEKEAELANRSYDPGVSEEEAVAGDLKISNPDALPDKLDGSALVREAGEYLEQLSEYRRNVTICKVEQKRNGTEVYCRFDNPRPDGKLLKVYWSERNRKYHISLTGENQ